MAAPNTTQKSPIVVTQGGSPVSFTAATDNPAVAFIQALGPDTFLVGQSAGSGVLTVTSGAQSTTLAFTISEAPLEITLGDPIPKA
jgi:hypothetical protein